MSNDKNDTFISLLDELLKATPDVQKACLDLVRGSHKTGFAALLSKVERIMNNDRLSAEERYDRIFCDEVSQVAYKLGLDYYDPDTSYEEDTEAFVNALREAAEEERRKEDNDEDSL